MTNLFYLITSILQFFPSISVDTPLDTLIPLAFVVILGMIRELVADLKRWKQDNITNSRLYNKITSANVLKEMSQIKSKDIRVGDILEIHDGQIIPADCFILQTSFPSGQCFVQTSSLDGEKNLKPKLAIKNIQDNLQNLLSR